MKLKPTLITNRTTLLKDNPHHQLLSSGCSSGRSRFLSGGGGGS